MNQKGFANILILAAALAIIIALSLGAYYYRAHFSSNQPEVSSPPPVSPTNSQLNNRQTLLTSSSSASIAPAANLNPTSSSIDQSSLQSLQQMVVSLQAQVNQLKQSNPQPSGTPSSNTSNSKAPVFIPLGSSDPINDTNWRYLDSVSANIDPNNYSGYTSMRLEVNLRVNSGGTANARLVNTSNQAVIANSPVSTTSTTFVLLTSGGFTLPAGSNLYKVQAMISSGDIMFIQNARIKVNF